MCCGKTVGGKDKGRKEKGRKAEDAALVYLERVVGLRLVARNWRCCHYELDLLMEDDERLHVIEVRSLENQKGMKAYETVGTVKRRRVLSAARAFVSYTGTVKEVVFDIVSVEFINGMINEILYFENAFTAE